MNNAFPPSGVELAQRHPHLHGLEAQHQNRITGNQDASLPSAIHGAVENVSRSLISLTKVVNIEESATQYNLR